MHRITVTVDWEKAVSVVSHEVLFGFSNKLGKCSARSTACSTRSTSSAYSTRNTRSTSRSRQRQPRRKGTTRHRCHRQLELVIQIEQRGPNGYTPALMSDAGRDRYVQQQGRDPEGHLPGRRSREQQCRLTHWCCCATAPGANRERCRTEHRGVSKHAVVELNRRGVFEDWTPIVR